MKIRGESVRIQEGHLETQGARIGVHGIIDFHGHCMDFTLLDKTPIGRNNRVRPIGFTAERRPLSRLYESRVSPPLDAGALFTQHLDQIQSVYIINILIKDL